MLELNLSLDSEEIYKDVKINSFGGRKSFDVNQENLDIIGKNIAEYIKRQKEEYKNKDEKRNSENEINRDITAAEGFNDCVVLTGATAIPVYLVAFHIVVHSFHEVKYKNEMYEVVVAKH
jgi:hypothetical protein